LGIAVNLKAAAFIPTIQSSAKFVLNFMDTKFSA